MVGLALAVAGCSDRPVERAAPPPPAAMPPAVVAPVPAPVPDTGPVVPKPTTVTVGRTADGGFSFELSRGEVFWLEQCEREDFEVSRAGDGGTWLPLHLYYADPNFKNGRILVDDGPPPKPNGTRGGCSNAGQKSPARRTSFNWSGNHLVRGWTVERAPAGHYRVELPGASKEFDIPQW